MYNKRVLHGLGRAMYPWLKCSIDPKVHSLKACSFLSTVRHVFLTVQSYIMPVSVFCLSMINFDEYNFLDTTGCPLERKALAMEHALDYLMV